jgi:hypothetical protein
MGFRIAWLATHNLERAELLGRLGLVDTGKTDSCNESAYSLTALPGGWSLIWSNDELFFTPAHLARLSEDAAILAVRVNETCMHSTAEWHEAGRLVWRVHHEGDEEINHLEVTGVPPPQLATIDKNNRVLQAEEDASANEVDFMFEIPLELARQLCGFKHDLVNEQVRFTALASSEAVPSSNFFRRLFGR